MTFKLKNFLSLFILVYFLFGVEVAFSQPKHAISMYDTPQLPHDFVSLPYASQSAQKGGVLRIGAVGTFDSVNPHIIKGRSPCCLLYTSPSPRDRYGSRMPSSA